MLKVLAACVALTMLSGCYRLPYNNFNPPNPLISLIKDNKRAIIRRLYKHNIEVVRYGDQWTLVVPTDQYYEFNSSRLHELQYKGLEAIVDLLRQFPNCTFVVASFSDNVDHSKTNWRLTNARAQTMVSFLWANGISSKQLIAQRFGESHPVGDNHLVRGRAYNRRLEIQWPLGHCGAEVELIPGVEKTK